MQTATSNEFNSWYQVTRGKEQLSLLESYSPAYKFVVMKDKSKVNSDDVEEKHAKSNDINYSTAKVIEALFDYNDIKNSERTYCEDGIQKKFENRDLSDSISYRLDGIHFNSYEELKEHFYSIVRPFLNKMKELDKAKAPQYEFNHVIDAFNRVNPFPSIKLEEYKYIDWKEIWAQMGHEDDFADSPKEDIGLTGSFVEKYLQENPDYSDLLDKMNTEAELISLEERLEFKRKNAAIIIMGLRARIQALSKCPQAKEAVQQNYADLKRVLIDLWNTFKGFPKTGNQLVDDYLANVQAKNKALI